MATGGVLRYVIETRRVSEAALRERFFLADASGFGEVCNFKTYAAGCELMNDPVGYYLTWVTYGTWLPGDSRGWVEYQRGWQLPDPILELESAAKMSDDACQLNDIQRDAVEEQIRETCRHRGWQLHAANCRSNHVHVVLSALEVRPKKIRIDLKAWATRRLKEQFDVNREKWWAERGSIRYLYDQESLDTVIKYVNEGQEKKS